MIREKQLFDPSDPLVRTRLSFMYIIAITTIVAGVGWGVAVSLVTDLSTTSLSLTMSALIVAAALVAVVLVRAKRLRLGALVLVSGLIAFVLLTDFVYIHLFASVIALVLAAVQLNVLLFGVAMSAIALNYVIPLVALFNESGFVYQTAGEQLIVHMAVVLTVGGITRYFVNTAERTARVSGRTASLLRANSGSGAKHRQTAHAG